MSSSGDDLTREARNDSQEAANLESSPRWSSKELLRGHCEATILHGDEVYRLRVTKNGKLILYK